ncbi:MAG: CHASE2 domain-containing protein [Candidatus Omnitrophica bacterium]|nr:CHASE2 domain-containing protein [Candidatus Omnitrophota bacterium]
MSKTVFKNILGILILLGTTYSLFCGSYFHIFEKLELDTLDMRFRLRPAIAKTDKVVIIEIDNDTIKKLGRFPIDRSYHARLINALSKFGAKAVVFDIFFSEPQKSDSELREAMRSAGNVYLPYVFEVNDKFEQKIMVADKYSAQNLEPLSSVAKGTGFINVLPDPDGKFRRAPLYIRYKDSLYPSSAFLAASDFLGIDPANRYMMPGEYLAYDTSNKIPLDENSNIIINYSGKWAQSFPHYSYGEILESYKDRYSGEKPPLDLNIFKGKVCWVGYTADGTTDLHPTPLESLYPAVGIHAEIFNSLLTKNFITRATKVQNLWVLFVLFFVVFVSSVTAAPLRAFVILLEVNAVFIGVSVVLFDLKGFWIDTFYPLVITSLVYLFCTVFRYMAQFKERVILENELKIAKQIQESFLPENLPEIDGFDTAVTMITARQVGGDLYDVLKFDNEKVGVMIGDVTGKGIPASLFMAMAASSFKFYALPEVSPEKTLLNLNEKIIRDFSSNRFVTVFYSIFDLKNKNMLFANGGHLPVLYFAAGQKPVSLDVEQGMPLGMMKGAYTNKKIKFDQGDIFIYYTDGITEAMNAKSVQYGLERLISVIEINRHLPALDICAAVESDVLGFRSKRKQQDDVTLIVIKIN